ncbi:MAG: Ankyrin [Verrucomicrobia bacterium]|nr:Ankyrin [Verrucomicrobiota bacterium]
MITPKILASALILSTCGLCLCIASQQSGARLAIGRMKAKDYFKNPVEARFVEAVVSGDTKTLSKLIQEGVNVNATGREGMRPLFWAIGQGNVKGFEFLLLNGADPNIVAPSSSGDGISVSVMGLSAIAANPAYLRLALRHGGDPNASAGYGNRTIIFESIMNNRLPNVQLLIEAGANLNHQDISGSPPIQDAATIGNFDMVYVLLNSGANPKLKDRWGYDLAADIEKYGARVTKGDREQHKWFLKVCTELQQRGLLKGAKSTGSTRAKDVGS